MGGGARRGRALSVPGRGRTSSSSGSSPRGLDYHLRDPAGRTAAAQISKGLGVELEGLDLEYVTLPENGSSWVVVRRDLGILGRTVRTILRRDDLAS